MQAVKSVIFSYCPWNQTREHQGVVAIRTLKATLFRFLITSHQPSWATVMTNFTTHTSWFNDNIKHVHVCISITRLSTYITPSKVVLHSILPGALSKKSNTKYSKATQGLTKQRWIHENTVLNLIEHMQRISIFKNAWFFGKGRQSLPT